MKTLRITLAIILLAFSYQTVNARIIHVPADSSTIQKGINGANNGDTVLVAPGNYTENITFSGKRITAASNLILFPQDTSIISQTVIQPANNVSVVSFQNGEDQAAVICGFTIKNGNGSIGGGIYCHGTYPMILKNKIIQNQWTQKGGGIYCFEGAHPSIIGNLIADNYAPSGGGIYCLINCDAYIKGNILLGNGAMAGGGICCEQSSPVIVNNTIDSTYIETKDKGPGAGIINLTPNSYPEVKNNIVTNTIEGFGIYGDGHITYNDCWNNGSPAVHWNFIGCPLGVGDTTCGINFNKTHCDSFYNIIKDPFYDSTSGNYSLSCKSPCIDAGDSAFCPLTVGGAKKDMGAIEYPYILGDADGDGYITVADLVFIINYLYKGSNIGPCPCRAGDANCSGLVEVGDLVAIIQYLYKNGPPPHCLLCKNEEQNREDGMLSLNKNSDCGWVGFVLPTTLSDGTVELSMLGEFNINISAIDLEIRYDSNKIKLMNPELVDMTKNLQIYYGFKEGVLKIGIIDIYGENLIHSGKGTVVSFPIQGTDLSSLEISKAFLVDENGNVFQASVTEKTNVSALIPAQFSLYQNHPNPFNPETEISFDLSHDSWVKLSIFNIRGQKVKTLVDRFEVTGHKTVTWNGTNESGTEVASGIYFYKMEAKDYSITKRMVLLR